jgi:hypothetical protein
MICALSSRRIHLSMASRATRITMRRLTIADTHRIEAPYRDASFLLHVTGEIKIVVRETDSHPVDAVSIYLIYSRRTSRLPSVTLGAR